MKIEDQNGCQIQTMDDWSMIYDKHGERSHWKSGRSAYSAADFILNHNGAEKLRQRVEELLGETVHFDRIVPEMEQRFDAYGRGRMHDLGITGWTAAGKSLFIGVEAKVDESFGPTINEAFAKASKAKENNPRSNARNRIEDLLALHFPDSDTAYNKLRYQLLYATAGTLAAGKDVSILYIAVFKTQSFNEEIGASNHEDYLRFLEKAGAQPLPVSGKNIDAHELTLNGKRLICVHEHFDL
jgi:hypothetical protein